MKASDILLVPVDVTKEDPVKNYVDKTDGTIVRIDGGISSNSAQ